MDIVFVKTRWHYQSYTDYWRLVELSDFPTCYVDEVDVTSDVTYIVSPMNGEWRPHIDAQRSKSKMATLLLWNLERPGGSGSLDAYCRDNHDLINNGYLDGVIVSDRALAKACGLKYVPLGSHEGLGMPGLEKTYDLICLMCWSHRRSFMFNYDKLVSSIGGLSVAPNGWGRERHERLQQSKFMFNIHQDDFPYIEPLRFALAAAYGLPIISDASMDPFPYSQWYLEGDIHSMIHIAKQAVSAYEQEWCARGAAMRDYMTAKMSFRTCLERYL